MLSKDKNKLHSQIVNLINESNNKEAAPLARVLCEEYPDDSDAFLLLGISLMNEGKYDKSRRSVLRALQKFPNEWKLHELLGHICGHFNRIAEAEKGYSAAIVHCKKATKEETALLHYLLGEAFWAQSKRDEALEQWNQALEIDPNCIKAKEAVKECTNEYNEPKAPNPAFDDLYHFQEIHSKRYFALVGHNEYTPQAELKTTLNIIMNGWNQYVSPRSREIDQMTTTEHSEFFKTITLNFTDAVMQWREKG